MKDIGNEIVGFFAVYAALVALLFPFVLWVRRLHLGEGKEKRAIRAIGWIGFLTLLGALVVLTIAYYLADR